MRHHFAYGFEVSIRSLNFKIKCFDFARRVFVFIRSQFNELFLLKVQIWEFFLYFWEHSVGQFTKELSMRFNSVFDFVVGELNTYWHHVAQRPKRSAVPQQHFFGLLDRSVFQQNSAFISILKFLIHSTSTSLPNIFAYLGCGMSPFFLRSKFGM